MLAIIMRRPSYLYVSERVVKAMADPANPRFEFTPVEGSFSFERSFDDVEVGNNAAWKERERVRKRVQERKAKKKNVHSKSKCQLCKLHFHTRAVGNPFLA